MSQDAEDEVIINVTEDSDAPASVNDELDAYTKKVSKRINKEKVKVREAEERAAQLAQIAQQKDQELNQFRNIAAQQQVTVLAKEEEALKSKEAQVDDIYQKAVASGDGELMSKATSLKNDVSIQKERLRVARNRQNQQQAAQQVQQPQQQMQPQQQAPQAPQAPIKPSSEALDWHERNNWFIASEEEAESASEESVEATKYAQFVHIDLIQQGVTADTDEYYEMLDSRIKKVYPNLSSSESEETVEQSRQQPGVQRVASAPSGGRRETRKNGVSFSKSEMERLRGLKPHDMDEKTWFQTVAKEKQKIAQREGF